MNGFPEQVLAGIIFPAELLAAVIIYMAPLAKKKHAAVRIAAGTVCYFAGIILYGVIASFWANGKMWIQTPLYGVYFLFVFLTAAVLVIGCCNVQLTDALHCVAFAYATQHFAYCMHRLIMHVDNPTLLKQYTPAYILIYGVVYAASYYFFARKLLQARREDADKMLSLQYAFVTLVVTLVLSTASQRFETQSPSLYRITLLYAMFCCGALLMGQLYQFRSLALQNELNLQQQMWQERKTQYTLSRENISLIHQKCHDLKHQVNALRSMSDDAERENRLRDLERSVMIYDSIVETGNDTIDTVLTEKSLICEENRIIMTCVADGDCLSFMDVIDLYTIFGNMLDNAIECVRVLEDEAKRVIAFQLFTRAGLVFIQCENYYEGRIRLGEDGVPLSTKGSGDYHGFGIKGMKRTAEKYDGFLTIDTQDHIFRVRITIPVPV